MTLTEPTEWQAETDLTEAEAEAVRETKALSDKAIEHYGDSLKGKRRRSIKPRARRQDNRTRPDYEGLQGSWATYYKVALAYERKVPVQDRDDLRHDIMVELERAEKRDGQPLPVLRAYRIASLMVALYYRQLNRFTSRVCVYNGLPVEPHCKGCRKQSEGKRCVWLAVRPVERLDGEVVTIEGYSIKLLDTVATDRLEDMPDKWFDLNQLKASLPMRLVEIAYLKLEGKPLSANDRQYLSRYRRQSQKALF